MSFAKAISHKKIGIGLLALLGTLPLLYAQRGEQPRGGGGGEGGHEAGPSRAAEPSRAPEPMRAPVQQRAAPEARVSHGSIRQENTRVIQRAAPVGKSIDFGRGADVRHDVVVHRDVEADFGRGRPWSGFAFGRRFHDLPAGYFSLSVGGVPYFYNDGLYYQSADDGGYQEVYPPVGAQVTQPPDGSVVVYAGDVAYYYAGGAFYIQQGDGYVIAPTPIGVTVPDLPPGAVQVSLNGTVAYQFNGIYYQPVFVNGVTQYETVNG